MTKEKTCADLVKGAFESRMKDIRELYWLATNEGDPETEAKQNRIRKELGTLSEYGLCIDYVEPNTFKDQPKGYHRYQLSWGGPSEEFRMWVGPFRRYTTIEFWYLDWFDGASITVTGKDAEIVQAIINHEV